MFLTLAKKILAIFTAMSGLFNVHTANVDNGPHQNNIFSKIATVTIGNDVKSYNSLTKALEYAAKHSSKDITAIVTLNKDVINCPTLQFKYGNVILNMESHTLKFKNKATGIDLSGGELSLHNKGTIISNSTDKKAATVKVEGGTFNLSDSNVENNGNDKSTAIYSSNGEVNILDGTVKSTNDNAITNESADVNVYAGSLEGKGDTVVSSANKIINFVPQKDKTITVTNSGNITDSICDNIKLDGDGTLKINAAQGYQCKQGTSNCSFDQGNLIVDVSKAASTDGSFAPSKSSDQPCVLNCQNYNAFVGKDKNSAKQVDTITNEDATATYANLVSYNKYDIKLNTNGGTYNLGYSEPISYVEDDKVDLPTANDISKTGYTFNGWFDNSEFNGDTISSITSTDTGDKEYFAKWTQDAISEPTTSEPTTSEPTTSEPTTSEPTTSEPTTSEPTTSEPTTSEPTTSEPTTSEPTVSQTTTPNAVDSATYIKPSFIRNDNTLVLNDKNSKATTVGFAYIGETDLAINTWNAFCVAGKKYSYQNGNLGYIKTITPENGFEKSLNTIGYYTAYIKYTNEDGIESIDFYTYKVNDGKSADEIITPTFTENGNTKTLDAKGYDIISIGYSYTGHTPHYFQDWDDFVNYGKKYTAINGSIGYNKVLSADDGTCFTLSDNGFYTCFIKYYDENHQIRYVGYSYQVGEKTPYFIMNSNNGAQMYDNGFKIISTGYIYCKAGTDIKAAKTWDGFLKVGQQCELNTNQRYNHSGYSKVTYQQKLGYRKIYDPSNNSLLYFDAAENGFSGGYYISFIKYMDGNETKYVWEDYTII